MTLGIIHLFELVTLARLERATSSSAGKRSNPLSYRVTTEVNIAPSNRKCKCSSKIALFAHLNAVNQELTRSVINS